MKTKSIRLLFVAICIISAITVTAFAADKTIAEQIAVVSYDDEVDYLNKMLEALEDGSDYALSMGSIYEQQRNLKIDQEELNLEKTYFFSDLNSVDEIKVALKSYINPSPYSLTNAERALVEGAVMAEARGESYEGQMMIAQCILDGALRNNLDIASSIDKYQIAVSSMSPSASVKKAVSAVFDTGERVTQESADIWYAYNICSSSWHEEQIYVTTIGDHKFFYMNKAH